MHACVKSTGGAWARPIQFGPGPGSLVSVCVCVCFYARTLKERRTAPSNKRKTPPSASPCHTQLFHCRSAPVSKAPRFAKCGPQSLLLRQAPSQTTFFSCCDEPSVWKMSATTRTYTRKPYTPANIFSLHRKRCELLLAICDNKSHPSMVSKR